MIFSIITVTFNAEKVLERTILSVLNQTYPQIEYISIDGDSSDGTKGIIEQYADAFACRISEKDKSLYEAMSKGLRRATGDYVWFLNAGDLIRHSNVVAEMAAVARLNNLPDILYGETDWMDSDGKVFARRRLRAPRRLTWKSFRNGMLVSHQAFIARRAIAPDFDLRYRFSGDFDWCIRCMKAARTIVNTRLRLVNYLYAGLTTANRRASLRERYRIMCLHYGTLPTLVVHLWFAIRSLWTWLRGAKH
ncbi:MAG: glycosyltransferase [Tannerellaceae bacterium]|jgi:glycosyltransferase involved in cell wall biosynthesis|nr:glycosyltransferase [Tannerellaceae bacterium]